MSVGLDLDNYFTKEVKNYGVECLDTEIDPNFPGSKETKEWNVDSLTMSFVGYDRTLSKSNVLSRQNKQIFKSRRSYIINNRQYK